MLRVQTTRGSVACVHMSKLPPAATTSRDDTVASMYGVFSSTDIVLGDMNNKWSSLVESKCVRSTVHRMATREEGTYLPGVQAETPIPPPCFDMVVVRRPLYVRTAARQPGKRLQPCKAPRSLMRNSQGSWPSDHTSVVAEVTSPHDMRPTIVSTWNVADPMYHGKFWPSARIGFGSEESDEAGRLVAIRSHVTTLLGLADVVALQEVPHSIADSLEGLGRGEGFQVFWMTSPSELDEEHGYLSLIGSGPSPKDLPSVPMDMLFVSKELVRNDVPGDGHPASLFSNK